MSTKIQEEYNLSKGYELSEIIVEKENLVELTQENVAKVEAMIRTDSNYRIDLDDEKKSPYWIKRMGDFLTGKSRDYQFKEIIGKIVELLDNENSTHLNADKAGRDFMKEKITGCIEDGTLLKYLRERDFKLIDILSERTKQGKGGRRNVSFASKFCHFSCFYIFKGEDAQDNFSIYDGVVARALPKYLAYYKLNDKVQIKDKNYREYSKAIDDIIKASGSKISRNGFDHLVWYYFKGK